MRLELSKGNVAEVCEGFHGVINNFEESQKTSNNQSTSSARSMTMNKSDIIFVISKPFKNWLANHKDILHWRARISRKIKLNYLSIELRYENWEIYSLDCGRIWYCKCVHLGSKWNSCFCWIECWDCLRFLGFFLW